MSASAMTLLTVSFLFFCAAALGGAVRAHGHATKTHLPGPLVVGHPLLAIAGAPHVPPPIQRAAADRELPHPTHDPGGPRGEVEEDP